MTYTRTRKKKMRKLGPVQPRKVSPPPIRSGHPNPTYEQPIRSGYPNPTYASVTRRKKRSV